MPSASERAVDPSDRLPPKSWANRFSQYAIQSAWHSTHVAQ